MNIQVFEDVLTANEQENMKKVDSINIDFN